MDAYQGRTASVVVGLFHNRDRAEQAIQDLRQAGFADRQIDAEMAGREEGGGSGFLGAIGRLFTGGDQAESHQIYNMLTGMGLPEERARYFEDHSRSGDEVVAVRANGRSADAQAILERCGADTGNFPAGTATTSPAVGVAPAQVADQTPIVERRSPVVEDTGTVTERGTVVEGSTVPVERRDVTTSRRDDTPQTIELREERLDVDKERVQYGEVEVRKEVVTETKTIEVPVTREELVIERHPVEPRPATSADFGAESETVRVPLTEERIHTEKHPVVTEEVTIDRREIESRERVSDTVRHEELRVEGEGETGRVEGDQPRRPSDR